MFGADNLQRKQIMKINEPFRGDFRTKNENNFLCIFQNINLVSVDRGSVCLRQHRSLVFFGDIRQA